MNKYFLLVLVFTTIFIFNSSFVHATCRYVEDCGSCAQSCTGGGISQCSKFECKRDPPSSSCNWRSGFAGFGCYDQACSSCSPPCTPSCSGASNYCVGTTFSDGCSGSCSGTKQPVNCQWNSWQNDTDSIDENGNVMRQTRTKSQVENSCGSCSGSNQQCRYYLDADGDGYGNATVLSDWTSCSSPPSGYVANNLDCNDNDDRVWNENVWWYKDQDGDQWYEHNSGVQSCNRPTEYHYVNTSESNYILRGTYNQICPGLENCNTRWIRNFLGGFEIGRAHV